MGRIVANTINIVSDG